MGSREGGGEEGGSCALGGGCELRALNIAATRSQGAGTARRAGGERAVPARRSVHPTPRLSPGQVSHVAATAARPARSPWGISRPEPPLRSADAAERVCRTRPCRKGARSPAPPGAAPQSGRGGPERPRGGARHRPCAPAAPRGLAVPGASGRRARTEGRRGGGVPGARPCAGSR